jgi:hypothetical protein
MYFIILKKYCSYITKQINDQLSKKKQQGYIVHQNTQLLDTKAVVKLDHVLRKNLDNNLYQPLKKSRVSLEQNFRIA